MISNSLVNVRVRYFFDLFPYVSILLIMLVGSANSFGEPVALIEHSADEQQVIISYSEVFGEIGEADNSMSVEVYGDGSVLVHYPHYMKKAGDYTMKLSGSGLGALLQFLAKKHIPEFDVDMAQSIKRVTEQEEKSRQSTLFAVSGASTSVIEINLDHYVPANKSGSGLGNIKQKISWYGLRSDKNRFPNIAVVQDLAAAQQEMLSLMSHPNLKRIK